MAESRGKRGAKTPRKITAQRLENMALYYLGRYASSSANLRRVLMRKVERAAAAHGADPAEGAKLIEDLIARYLRSGLIDDRAYAAQKAASLQRRGASRFGIKGKLRQKGVEGALIDVRAPGPGRTGRLRQRTRIGLRAGPPPAARALPREKQAQGPARQGFGRFVPRRFRLRGGKARAGRARHRGGRETRARQGRGMIRITSFSWAPPAAGIYPAG